MDTRGIEEFSLPTRGAAAGNGERQGWSTWPAPARWAFGCGLGCLAAIVLQALLFGAIVLAWVAMLPPEGLEVRARAPARVRLGQTFPLTVIVRNTGATPFTVTAVAVQKKTKRRVELTNPQPKPLMEVSPWDMATSWSYQQVVEPGKSWTVRFDAVASQAGTLEGSVDVQSGGIRSGHFTIQALESGATLPPARSH